MSFDLERSLRLLKPQKRTAPLVRRPDEALRWAIDEFPVGAPLLLDTTVYLDVLQGRSPPSVDRMLASRLCHHSSVCLAELTHLFGRLDPRHPATRQVLRHIRGTIDDIPLHRLHAPDASLWGEAGITAGEIARLANLPKDSGRKLLNDALIHFQARTLGIGLLTGNVRDFDWLDQLVPDVRLIFYRPV